jgi:cell division protein FtsB
MTGPDPRRGVRTWHSLARGSVRLVWPAVIVALTCGVFFLGVFPTRTYLDQRESIASAEVRLRELDERNDTLERQAEILDSDDEIERIARADYGLARPGEELYQVLPPPQDPVTVPPVWPFHRLDQQIGR